MTKFEWERQLKKGIASLPKSEQQRVLDYYSELFADKIESRMREEEVIAEFGNPYDVANRLIVDYYNEARTENNTDDYVYRQSEKMNFDDFDNIANGNKRAAAPKYEKPQETPCANQPECKPRKERKHAAKGGAAISSVWLISALVFLTIGAIWGVWHPVWMIFLAAIVVTSIITAVQKKNLLHLNYPVLMVILYLLLGFYANMWHPMWLIFVTIPLFYSFAGSIRKGNKNEEPIVTQSRETSESRTCQPEYKMRREEKREPQFETVKPVKKQASTGSVVGAIILAAVFIWLAIVVWSVVISLFIGGIAMTAAGVAVLVVGIGQIVSGAVTALLILGAGLLLTGAGLMFAIGMGSLFKQCVKMCKAMGRVIAGVAGVSGGAV